ncbi:unnamed protein product [Mucor circinelloides]
MTNRTKARASAAPRRNKKTKDLETIFRNVLKRWVSTDDDSGYDYGDIVIYDTEDKNAKREKRDLCRHSQ